MHIKLLRLALPILFLAAGPGSLAAGTTRNGGFTPNVQPTLVVRPVSGEIVIDGDLSDGGWKDAARAGNFTEISPGDQVKPQVDTKVMVTYDHDRLYVAFIASDEPSAIRASFRARDDIFADDFVGLILDTYDNAAWAYEIYVNPLGVQGDLRWTSQGEDEGFDVVFDAEAKITDGGYQVEMAIPFKSLRFPDKDEQRWRVSFFRIRPRDSRRQDSWATVSRDDPCLLCQLGYLEGIRGVRPGSSFEFIPTLVGSQSGELEDFTDPGSGFRNQRPDVEPSFSLRYGLTSSVSTELTVNPDFSQVESDVAQIDVNTTFALYFPERRPFFQEGSDLFRTWWNVVYTRTINDPSIALKTTGRTSRTSFVALAARDEHTPLVLPFEEQSIVAETGKSYAGIMRGRRTIKEDSYVGAIATGRWYEGGGFNGVVGADGLGRFRKNYILKSQILWSRTAEPDRPGLTEGAGIVKFDRGRHTVALDGETLGGYGLYSGFARSARHWNWNLDYMDASPTFRADLGFVVRNNDRRLSLENTYVFYPDNKWFDEIRPYNRTTRRWNSFSVRKAQSIENWLEVKFKTQTTVSVGYDFNSEFFGGVHFNDMRLFYAEMRTAFSDALHCGFWMGLGDRIARTEDPPALGEGGHLDAWATIKPMQQLVIEPLLTYSSLSRKDTGEEVFDGYILRTKINYQLNRELFFRLVVQYDDFTGELAVEPLVTYQINAFSVFYVGGGTNYLDYLRFPPDPGRKYDGFRPTEWHVFFKLQYFFRV